MENIRVPYKAETQVLTFEGDWTAEEIDAGLAGDPTNVEVSETWFEPTEDGPVPVTDPQRIDELEAKLRRLGR